MSATRRPWALGWRGCSPWPGTRWSARRAGPQPVPRRSRRCSTPWTRSWSPSPGRSSSSACPHCARPSPSSPRERERIAERLLHRRGGTGSARSLLRTSADPLLLARARALEENVSRLLDRHGLRTEEAPA
ncbi:hypothetical protein ACFQZC_24805 [Streptacidiphilus monticola]